MQLGTKTCLALFFCGFLFANMSLVMYCKPDGADEYDVIMIKTPAILNSFDLTKRRRALVPSLE